jgi:hypothetical protein
VSDAPLELEPELFSCFLDFVPASPAPPYPVSEPIEPELVPLVEPVPIEEPLPLLVLPLVLGVEPVVPVVPPLVEPPVCAKAAPAANMEMIANRFHHVFMRNTLRFGRTVVALLQRGGCVLSARSVIPPSDARSGVGRSREPPAGSPDVGT